MKIPKIVNVIPEKNLLLIVTFSDGSKRYYDCNQVLDRNEYYNRLNNFHYFKNVQIDNGGHGVSWDDEVDISEYEIFKNGV